MSAQEQVWRELIESQPWSGQTVAEWCEGASVSIASFYRWKKLLAEPQGARRRRSTQRSAVRASGSTKRTSQFVPIAVRQPGMRSDDSSRTASSHGSIVRIEFPNGVVIHVSDTLDGQRLGDVIIAAGQVPCVPSGSTTTGSLHEVSPC
jgi:hypothetical protein